MSTTPAEVLSHLNLTDDDRVSVALGASWQATRDLLAIGADLPPRARDIVETLALVLGVDDPHEDGAPVGVAS